MPIGVYGKYPGKRDFIALNLPRSVLQPIENWLAAALATSRELLGRKWQGHYMVQPVWDFRIGAGICGRECIGAMVPSVDGVGRTFPLIMLACASAADECYLEPSDDAESGQWLDQVHERLLLALGDEPPRDPGDLVAGLGEPGAKQLGLPREIVKIGKGVRGFWRDGSGEKVAALMDEYHAARAGRNHSVWWTAGSPLVVNCEMRRLQSADRVCAFATTHAKCTRQGRYRRRCELNPGQRQRLVEESKNWLRRRPRKRSVAPVRRPLGSPQTSPAAAAKSRAASAAAARSRAASSAK